jgi:hypothetical protein
MSCLGYWRRIVFTIQSQSRSRGQRWVYLFGKGLRPTGLDQRHDTDEQLLLDSIIGGITRILQRLQRWWTLWAYRFTRWGLQVDLGFMAMEYTAVTWHSCSIPHLGEWASLYIGTNGRFLHVARQVFIVVDVKSTSWSWYDGVRWS